MRSKDKDGPTQKASLCVLPSTSWSSSLHDDAYADEQGGADPHRGGGGTREGTAEPLRKTGAHRRAALQFPRRYVQHTPDIPLAPDSRRRRAARCHLQGAATSTRRGCLSRGADIPAVAGGWSLRRADGVCVAVRRGAGAILAVLGGRGRVATRMVRRG